MEDVVVGAGEGGGEALAALAALTEGPSERAVADADFHLRGPALVEDVADQGVDAVAGAERVVEDVEAVVVGGGRGGG